MAHIDAIYTMKNILHLYGKKNKVKLFLITSILFAMETIAVPAVGQLGPLLRILRNRRKLSQTQLGVKLGLSQERISFIERNPQKVSVETLFTVLMALEVEVLLVPREGTAQTVSTQPAVW